MTRRSGAPSPFLVVAAVALFGGCAASGTDSTADAGLAPDVAHIDPVYGEPEAGILVGGGGAAGDLDAQAHGDAGIAAGLVVNEVDYDNVGTDTAEFVEIYNPTSGALDLSNVALVLVDSVSEYGRVDLSGSLGPGRYLVLGSPAVAIPDAGAVRIALPSSTNALRNGTAAVGLLDKTHGVLIDALSYGGAVTAAAVNGVTGPVNFVEGTASAAADSNTANGSVARIPNGKDTNDAATDFSFSNTPTAGATNVP